MGGKKAGIPNPASIGSMDAFVVTGAAKAKLDAEKLDRDRKALAEHVVQRVCSEPYPFVQPCDSPWSAPSDLLSRHSSRLPFLQQVL